MRVFSLTLPNVLFELILVYYWSAIPLKSMETSELAPTPGAAPGYERNFSVKFSALEDAVKGVIGHARTMESRPARLAQSIFSHLSHLDELNNQILKTHSRYFGELADKLQQALDKRVVTPKTWHAYAEQAGRIEALVNRRISREVSAIGVENCGPYISGIFSDAFPEKAKNRLRTGRKAIRYAMDEALALRPKYRKRTKHTAIVREIKHNSLIGSAPVQHS